MSVDAEEDIRPEKLMVGEMVKWFQEVGHACLNTTQRGSYGDGVRTIWRRRVRDHHCKDIRIDGWTGIIRVWFGFSIPGVSIRQSFPSWTIFNSLSGFHRRYSLTKMGASWSRNDVRQKMSDTHKATGVLGGT